MAKFLSEGYLNGVAKTVAFQYLEACGKHKQYADSNFDLRDISWGIAIADDGSMKLRVYFPRNTVTTAMNSVHFDHAKAMHYIEQPLA